MFNKDSLVPIWSKTLEDGVTAIGSSGAMSGGGGSWQGGVLSIQLEAQIRQETTLLQVYSMHHALP